MKTALACLAAASALALMPAAAAPKPKWEVGVGAFATYSPAYWGASRDSDDFGGFPVVYFIYRGEDISIFSNGLFDVDSNNTERFTFGVSVDGSGGVDSEDRHGLGDIDPDHRPLGPGEGRDERFRRHDPGVRHVGFERRHGTRPPRRLQRRVDV